VFLLPGDYNCTCHVYLYLECTYRTCTCIVHIVYVVTLACTRTVNIPTRGTKYICSQYLYITVLTVYTRTIYNQYLYVVLIVYTGTDYIYSHYLYIYIVLVVYTRSINYRHILYLLIVYTVYIESVLSICTDQKLPVQYMQAVHTPCM
jgi:hypothetical protein